MKRLFLILFSFLLIGSADAGQLRILSPFISSADVCTKDGTPSQAYPSDNDGGASLDADTEGQVLTISSESLYSLEVKMGATTDCIVSFRIGTDPDLSVGGNVVEEWANVDVGTIAVTDDVELVSETNDLYNGTYYLGWVEEAGICKIRYDHDDPIGGARVEGTGWVMGADNSPRTYWVRFNPCQ